MDGLQNHDGPAICILHEKYALRVNTMWGGFKILVTFLILAFGVIGTIIVDTRANTERNRSESIARDQAIAEKFLVLNTELNNDNNDIIRVLNVISVNQKRVMDHLDLEYMSPEWVRGRNGDDH